MPGYKSHLIGGAVAFVPALYILRSYAHSIDVAAWWFVFALSGALFPDVDTKSKGQKWFYRLIAGSVLAALFTKQFALLIFLSIASLVPQIVNHRGLFHRLWFVVLIPFGVAAGLSWYQSNSMIGSLLPTLFFVIGAVSHLWLDLGFRRMLVSWRP